MPDPVPALVDYPPYVYAGLPFSGYARQYLTPAHSEITWIDCEGKCCCRCYACKGVGHYSSYRITIPQVTQYLPPDGPPPAPFNAPSFLLFSSGPFVFDSTNIVKFGSEGGGGGCGGFLLAEPYTFTIGMTTYTIDKLLIQWTVDNNIDINITEQSVPFSVLRPIISTYSFTSNPTTPDPSNCISGWTRDYTEATGSAGGVLDRRWLSDFTGLTVTVEPSPGAEWRQCGQNSDGTEYVPMMATNPMLAAIQKAVGPGVKVRMDRAGNVTTGRTGAVQIPRPDRCASLGKRIELRQGCGGWGCRHDCELGLPAVPGEFCQTCKLYVADPDFIGRGTGGWTQ